MLSEETKQTLAECCLSEQQANKLQLTQERLLQICLIVKSGRPVVKKKILARSINVQEFNQCDIVWGYLQYKHPLWSNCIIQNHLQKKLLITWYHLCRSMKIWSECVNISAKISASIEKLKEKTKIFLLELMLIKS